jgi:hypothetical protein
MNILELAGSIGWPVEFIAFERGIVLRPMGEAWVTHSASRGGPVEISVEDAARQWLPVLIRCRFENDSSPLDVMLRPDGGFARGVPSFITPPGLLYDAFALQYLSGALVHHVLGIVRAYEQVRDKFKRFDLIPGAERERRGLFSGQPEPYYEFDALLSVARRGYDACRYLMWKCFGTKGRSRPRSFERVLPLCDRLDPDTRRDLEKSWRVWGAQLTEYRDCIHHYVPVDFGKTSIHMEEQLPGV